MANYKVVTIFHIQKLKLLEGYLKIHPSLLQTAVVRKAEVGVQVARHSPPCPTMPVPALPSPVPPPPGHLLASSTTYFL